MDAITAKRSVMSWLKIMLNPMEGNCNADINLKDIEEAIIKGMIKGYKENLLLTTDYNRFQLKITEYLLTVNVAQSLIRWNENYIYKINIEYPFSEYINNAFASHTIIRETDDLFTATQILVRKKHISSRKLVKEKKSKQGDIEKIDIAITKETALGSIISLIGIELKGIVTSMESIKKDIKRLKQAINATDNVSKNSILAGYQCFIKNLSTEGSGSKRLKVKRLKGTHITVQPASSTHLPQNHTEKEILTQEQIDLKVKKLKEKWQKAIKGIEQVGLVEVFVIEATSEEDVIDIHKQKESSYAEVAADTGIVVGVLLKILKD